MGITQEIKWHGPVEQEVMRFASLLAELLAMQGKWVQTFPSNRHGLEKCYRFSEAYNRISDSPIKRHLGVKCADISVIMDLSPFLASNTVIDLKENTSENACYIINTSFPAQWIKEKFNLSSNVIYTLDIPVIAKQEMLNYNAFVALMGVVIQKIDRVDIQAFKDHMAELLSKAFDSNEVTAQLFAVDMGIHEARKTDEHIRRYND